MRDFIPDPTAISNHLSIPTCVTRLASLAVLLPTFALAQGAADVSAQVMQGERVFNKSCATGYCHGSRGSAGGAPRLAARGFEQGFINATVTRGISGTAMPAFATSLDRGDLTAVVAYVASLNGIVDSSAIARSRGPTLRPEAARGRELFFDATRSFARCSTCHEVGGVGIPVATPIATVPANVQDLRNLVTPGVRTAVIAGQSMPALLVSEGKRRTIVYDLTSAPPVLRTQDPGTIRITDGSSWKHSSSMGSYSDAELSAILTYLSAVAR